MALELVPTRQVVPPDDGRSAHRLGDYARASRDFSWETARRWLAGAPNGGRNIAYEAVDRHAEGDGAQRVAVAYRDATGRPRELTYADARRVTNQFANLLQSLGVAPGEVVASLAGHTVDVVVATIGALKNASVCVALHPCLDPIEIRRRLALARARVLVTTPELYHHVVAHMSPPYLDHVLVTGASTDHVTGAGDSVETHDLRTSLPRMDEDFDIPPTDPDSAALVHFTSGTTGVAKGAVHSHEAVVAYHATAAYALDVTADDVYWCTSHPAEVGGLPYSVIAPLTHGATVVLEDVAGDPRRLYEVVQERRVSVLCTTPSVLARAERAGMGAARAYDVSSLRFVASLGGQLPPALVTWGQEALGRVVHDMWWQTETGVIAISNFASMDVRPGSMGRPVPGVTVGLMTDDADELVSPDDVVIDPDQVGELVVRTDLPSLFIGYLDDYESYDASFAAGWYRTGDLVRRDHDGYYWYVGRGSRGYVTPA
ncbi:AMP-binding protein [Thermasporomyces composti]|uniref:Acetyl-CoA synthetase n=1 Tax=Thermasporomyces composti TaxID=696763 RepID=A0A3D9V9E2_THECX|nr:AMP-binding protein [Thermasporomyces composti]REF38109.1 acetyl-CoA synthetase [Thermasporomyces composti]